MAFGLVKSVDGINFDTNAVNVTTVTCTNVLWPSGTNSGTWVYNLAMDGVGYGRVSSILITGTLNMTNPVVTYSQKANSP